MGLGAVNVRKLGECLQEARKRAADARELLARGEDPLAVKRVQEAQKSRSELTTVKTFGECAAAYLAAHGSSWKSLTHARQWGQCLDDYVLPVIGRLPVADVAPGDVKRVLQPLWKTKPEVARKTCGKIGMVLEMAIAHEWRSTINPATLRIMRKLLGPLQQKPKHHPSMPWKDVPAFMRKIEDRRDVPALALQWLMLTATRSSEARCATWQEIDRDKGLWTIPGHRMKGGAEHVVPISLRALGVLKAVPRLANSPYVFPGPGGEPISETSLRNILREFGIDKHTASLHGFRSSFRTWCAETGVANDVAEACLAHAVPDAVVRAYKWTKFLEAREGVMQLWGLHLS